MPNVLPHPTGRPDPTTAALIAAMNSYFDSPVTSAEDRIELIRGAHHMIAAAYRGWSINTARGHYADDPTTRVRLVDTADVSGIAVSTTQMHAEKGLDMMVGAEREAAERVRSRRRARRHRDGRAA